MTASISAESKAPESPRTALIFLAIALILGGVLRALPLIRSRSTMADYSGR